MKLLHVLTHDRQWRPLLRL